MEYSKTFVFQEINIGNAILYLWYKLAEETNIYGGIVPYQLLTPEQHQAALMYE